MKQKVCYYCSLGLAIVLVCSFYFLFNEYKKNKDTLYDLNKEIATLHYQIETKKEEIVNNTEEINKLKKEKKQEIEGYSNWQRWLKELNDLF